MNSETILYIVIAAIVSFALAVFMYGYKTKYKGSLRWLFGVLRFITLFSVLLLLINPKFRTESYTIEKPKLPILIDNSASVVTLGKNESVKASLKGLQENNELSDKFDISYYTFGSNFTENDSLSFSDRNTNISKAIQQTNELFKNEVAPTILITDGNQTFGRDYEFSTAGFKNKIYPIVVGDSTQYVDLKIDQLNANKYSFLKNQFPIEAIVVYSGQGTVSSQFTIRQGNTIVYKEILTLSENDNTKTVSTTLPSTNVGLQRYSAQIAPLNLEKNTINNTKRFAIEVIDQATNVLVVSEMSHPDIGALKKAISSNEQRRFVLKKPIAAAGTLNDYELVILYQPNRSFSSIFSEIEQLKKNTLVITGLATDWDFLNSAQTNFNKQVSSQTEDASANLNMNYGTFAVEDIGFGDFPPLQTQFGGLEITIPNDVLLQQRIDGFDSGTALLTTMELNGKRDAILDGEGLWKWRAQTYRETNSFQDFDEFFSKLIQYLASSKRKSRLEVSNETFYYNNNNIKISAQYFDKSFVFDNRASLNISVVHQDDKTRTVFPMILKNNFYEVDLNSLPAGEYRYTVSVQSESVARSGSFTILDFDVEQQFGNANVTKLRRLATNTEGKLFFLTENGNQQDLISTLLEDANFKPIQKSEEKVTPLIDWKYLLGLIVLTLALEWFIRKYNGLI